MNTNNGVVLSKRCLRALIAAGALLLCLFIATAEGEAAVPTYHGIPAYQQKDVFSASRVSVEGLNVLDSEGEAIEEPVRFLLFNSTTQETEMEFSSENGRLPEMKLIREHDYMLVAEDSKYQMDNAYFWVHDDRLLDIKHYTAAGEYPTVAEYPVLNEVRLSLRAAEEGNPREARRVVSEIPVKYKNVPKSGVEFLLVSDAETIEATSSGGKLRVSLLEDINYMVISNDTRYDIESFPIAVKDKSEYGALKYTYDHSSCKRVGFDEQSGKEYRIIELLDKGGAHGKDSVIESESGLTRVGGMNFKDLLVLERNLDRGAVSGMDDKDYEVLRIAAVNPHRWEISKLARGDFSIWRKNPSGKKIAAVYELQKDGSLSRLEHRAEDGGASFRTDSLSLKPLVIEYKAAEDKKPPAKPAARPAATSVKSLSAGKRRMTVTVKRQAKNSTGYQLQYSLKKNFKSGNRHYSTKTNKHTEIKLNKLKSGKRYYVRVRVYRNVKIKGKTKRVYSNWSKARSVKVR